MKYFYFLFFLAVLSSCGIPKDALKLQGDSLEQRQLQTRSFHTSDESKVFNASISTLQDMGFSIDNSEKSLGVIVSSKKASAYNAGEIAGAVVLAVLTGTVTPVSKNQVIKASVIISKSTSNKKSYNVRVTFQRIVWNTNGQIHILESLNDKELYSGFFERISKSMFLEANEI